MPTLTLTLQQTAEVVTDLARGKATATVAARRHLPVGVVDQLETLYGPGRADLSRHSKLLNKKLRDQRPVEDLDVDVPVSPPSPPRRAAEDTVAPPDELEPPIPAPVPALHLMTGEHIHSLGARLHDCEACRDEAVDPPVIVEGAVVNPAPAEVTHLPLNGQDMGVAAAQLVAKIADALPQFSSTTEKEVTGGVGPGDSQGWLAPGARTVERLLDEASRIDSGRIRDQLDEVKEAIAALADLVDQWAVQAVQRQAIRHELEVLGRRQDELVAKLAELDALGSSVVTVQTSTVGRDATAAVEPEAGGKRPGLGSLPFYRMSVEARRRCKDWAKTHGYKFAEKGQQPALTVAAYLAVHPEDDPR